MSIPETFSIGGELEVNRLGFGAMRITGQGIWGDPEDTAAARALLHDVVAAGVNLIDTADSYGPGVSEQLIAEALQPYPEGLVIATKGGLTRPAPGVWDVDCHPKRLRQCCEASLRRLGLERIDLYQLHAVDPKIPIEDSVAALAELQEEEKIRFVGLSNVDVEQLNRAREVTEIVSVQNAYNLARRDNEELLQECERERIAFLPYFPLNVGALAARGGALDEIARGRRVAPSQIALSWLLHHSPVILPIPGTSSAAHLRENVEAWQISLEPDEIEALESAVATG